MNTLTVRPTGLIRLRRCPVRWCWHYGNDVPADSAHESDLPPITLALEGGAQMPEEFVYDDGPDSFEPGDYGLPHARVTLMQHPDEDPHITIDTYHVDRPGKSPRFTLAEAKQVRDQLDELLALAEKAGTR